MPATQNGRTYYASGREQNGKTKQTPHAAKKKRKRKRRKSRY